MEAVILAAGLGSRMSTKQPLVLHRVAEDPLICCAVQALLDNGVFRQITVVVQPSQLDTVRKVLTDTFPEATFAFAEHSAEGDAVASAACGLAAVGAQPDALVAVVPGNQPLLRPVIHNLLHCCPAQPTSSQAAQPVASEYSIRFASHFQLAWQPNEPREGESNGTSACASDGPILVARAQFLSHQLQDALVKKRLLEDALQECCREQPESCLRLSSPAHLLAPVNTRRSQVIAEQQLKSQRMTELSEAGVTFRDPAGTFLGPCVQVGQDSTVGVGVQLYGKTKIGCNVRIDGPTMLTNATIGDGCHIRAFSVIEDAVMDAESIAGPFTRLRTGSHLETKSYAGNFVELKHAHLSRDSLACHLAYLGDAHVGPRTNVGAGTITCNFDGVAKNVTHIGAEAFVGSNSTLVAPVKIGDGALIAAGSVVTQDVAPGAAVFGRARQTSRDGFAAVLRTRSSLRHNSATATDVSLTDSANGNGAAHHHAKSQDEVPTVDDNEEDTDHNIAQS